MVDDNEFFRNATLKICGNLAIEEAMRDCIGYLAAFIPVDRMFMQVYESDLAAMRTLAVATADRGEEVDLLTGNEQLQPYERAFRGHPDGWVGSYTPWDEAGPEGDPERRAQWRLGYRVQKVETADEGGR